MNDAPNDRRETADEITAEITAEITDDTTDDTTPGIPTQNRERDRAMHDSPHHDADPEIEIDGAPQYRRAFAVADALAAHGPDCVCPRCAGRLPGLLAELARAVDAATVR